MNSQLPSDELTVQINKWGRAEFVAADGRVMFEVAPCKDGHTIEVRSVETCKVAGVIYAAMLSVRPRVSNVIEVSTVPYDAI